MTKKFEFKYQEVSLEEIMQYYIKGFEPTKKQKIRFREVEYFIDPQKQKVVFKMFVEELD